jgi:hypothetical protein
MLPKPETFAAATANAVLATLALGTKPDMLAPAILLMLLPSPFKYSAPIVLALAKKSTLVLILPY